MFDIIIIGSGPAGLTAALYSGRRNMNVLVIGELFGGRIVYAKKIENYPGFVSVSGSELMETMCKQLEHYSNITMENGSVKRIEQVNKHFKVYYNSKTVNSRTVIIATGGIDRKLNVPGESEFLGRGVSYCATCDAGFFKDKSIALVGGGNAAMSGLEELAGFAKNIYLIHRRKELTAENAVIDRIKKLPNVKFLLGEEINEIKGSEVVEKVVLKSGKTLKVDGVFIEIGVSPASEIARPLNIKFDGNFVNVDDKQMTSLSGLFACGDITSRNGNLKQLVVACGEGAVAGYFASEFLKK